MSADVPDEVLALLSRVAGRVVTGEAATPLFDAGLGLDSVALLEIVVALEERFGVRVRPDEDGHAFATIGTLATFVAERRAAKSDA